MKTTKYAGTLYLEKDFYDDIADLGWEYTCGRLSRSGMEVYDQIMTRLGVPIRGTLERRLLSRSRKCGH